MTRALLPVASTFPSLPNTISPPFPSDASRTLPALPPQSSFSSSNSKDNDNGGGITGSPSHIPSPAVLGTVASLLTLVILALLIFFIRRSHTKNKESSVKDRKEIVKFRRFGYKEIQMATDNFSSIIGKGQVAVVYKAQFEDGLVGAVKRMPRVGRRNDKGLVKTLESLARLHHRHLLMLRGYGMTSTERFLIYEYMDNGSLKEHLQAGFSTVLLGWNSRKQIAIDVAVALDYLHTLCDPPVVHGDIKSSNILLDRFYVTKVADFGIAAILGTKTFNKNTLPVHRGEDKADDVYCYGLLLLELITGQCVTEGNGNLASWVQSYLSSAGDKPLQMVDKILGDVIDMGELQSLTTVAKMCLEGERKLRPSIHQVLAYLYTKVADMETSNAIAHDAMYEENINKGYATSNTLSDLLHPLQ